MTPGVGNFPCLTSIGFLPASIIELTVTCKSIRLSYSMVVIRSGETRGLPSAPSNSAASGFRLARINRWFKSRTTIACRRMLFRSEFCGFSNTWSPIVAAGRNREGGTETTSMKKMSAEATGRPEGSLAGAETERGILEAVALASGPCGA